MVWVTRLNSKKTSSMIASIMQPYVLPYIGYFQLVACSDIFVDIFVAHDDVQYIKGRSSPRHALVKMASNRYFALKKSSGILVVATSQPNLAARSLTSSVDHHRPI